LLKKQVVNVLFKKWGGGRFSEVVCPVILSFKASFELISFFYIGGFFHAVFIYKWLNIGYFFFRSGALWC